MRLNTFALSGAAWAPKAAEAVAGYWSTIGVKVNIAPYDFGAFGQLYRAKPKPPELQGAAHTQPSAITLNPLLFQRAMTHSKGIMEVCLQPKGSSTLCAELDPLIDEAQATVDPQRQIALIRQISDLTHDSYVAPALLTASALFAATPDIKGWSPGPANFIGTVLETVEPQ